MQHEEIADVTIINQCASTIKAVRVTHFLHNFNEASTLFIRESMNVGESGVQKFESRKSYNDNWTVSFQTGNGCFMCGKIDKSMDKGRKNYTLVITDDKFTFQYTDDDGTIHKTSATVKSVYDFL